MRFDVGMVFTDEQDLVSFIAVSRRSMLGNMPTFTVVSGISLGRDNAVMPGQGQGWTVNY